MSKGSRPRPLTISQEELASRIEGIFGKKEPKERYVPPPLPEFTKEESKVEWGSDVKDSQQGG